MQNEDRIIVEKEYKEYEYFNMFNKNGYRWGTDSCR